MDYTVTVPESDHAIIGVASDITVVVPSAEASVIVAEPSIVQGSVQKTDGVYIKAVAGVVLGGDRVVVVDDNGNAVYATNRNIDHAFLKAGLTRHAAVQGGDIEILVDGSVTNTAWNWVPKGLLFLGDNGLMTQVEPVSPALFQMCIGIAITATRIQFCFQEPIFLV